MADSTNPWRKSSFEDRRANEICTCKLAPLSTWRVCSLPEPNKRYGHCLIRLESGDLIIFIERGCSHETYCYPLQVGCFVYLELSDDCPDNSRWDLVALLSSLKHCWFISDTFRSRRRLPSLRLSDSLNQLIGFRGIHIVCCPFCCLWFCHSRSSPLGDSSLASYLWIVSHMKYIQSSGRQHTYAV